MPPESACIFPRKPTESTVCAVLAGQLPDRLEYEKLCLSAL